MILFVVLLFELHEFCIPESSLSFAHDRKWCMSPALSPALTLNTLMVFSPPGEIQQLHGAWCLAVSWVKATTQAVENSYLARLLPEAKTPLLQVKSINISGGMLDGTTDHPAPVSDYDY